MSSNKPDGSGSEVDGGEEVASGFVVAGGDGTEELEFGEEVFDQVACLVEFLVALSLHGSIGPGRDDGLFSGLLQRFQHPLIGVKALIGNHDVGFELRQQHVGSLQLAGLAFGEMKANGVAERIHGGVNLGAQPTLAASNGLR